MNSSDQPKPRRIFTEAPPHAQSSERIRQTFAGQGIRRARMAGRNASDDEIYREVGYRDANEYWSDAMSEPMKVSSFAYLLEGYFLNPALDGCNLYRLEIGGALRSAKDAGEQWFIEVPDKELMLHPRKAAAWLLSKPKRRHLLPPGLATFLQSSERRDAPESSLKTVAAIAPELSRKRGREPAVLNRVVNEMRETLKRQEMTRDQLKTMREKSLSEQFNASRDTCRKALAIVLS
jgi:hypothetical protein